MNTLLVIGYGNTLRRDDGAGPRVAEAVEELNLPGVSVHTCHQLTPELVDMISNSQAVAFIDAAVDVAEIKLQEIQPKADGQILAHATDPQSLLGLAGQLFGDRPRAWTLAIPAEDLGFGEQLSKRTAAACHAAVGQIQTLVQTMQLARPSK